jgi:hypothetical protein
MDIAWQFLGSVAGRFERERERGRESKECAQDETLLIVGKRREGGTHQHLSQIPGP